LFDVLTDVSISDFSLTADTGSLLFIELNGLKSDDDDDDDDAEPNPSFGLASLSFFVTGTGEGGRRMAVSTFLEAAIAGIGFRFNQLAKSTGIPDVLTSEKDGYLMLSESSAGEEDEACLLRF